MSGNRGDTRVKLKRRSTCPMRDYDRLPPELRAWLSTAVLPWGPRSVARAYARAVQRTHDKTRALAELDRIQQRLIARDVRKVWGQQHPEARGPQGR